MKWVGTLAVVGKVRKIVPDSTELRGMIEVEVVITNLMAPIVKVTFDSSGQQRECSDLAFRNQGQEHTSVFCWLMESAPEQTLENVTVHAANGLTAVSYAVFNRFKKGDFINISDSVGSNIGGDKVTIFTSDLNARINLITVGDKECLYLKVDENYPHSRASCQIPPHILTGPVSVVVYAPNTNFATGTNAYTYYKPANILTVDPEQGGVKGNTLVTITTTDMGMPISYVEFGGLKAEMGPGPTNNFVVVFSPWSPERGAVDIIVRSDNGNFAKKEGAYTYMVECEDPGVPENGYRTGTEFVEGSKLKFACRYGYSLNGPAEVTCEYERDKSGNIIVHGGLFQPPRPSCDVVTCPDPGTPKFGSRVTSFNGTFPFKALVTFYCPSGYTRFGPAEIFCQGNGLFSGPTPTCESDYGVLTLVRYRGIFLTQFEQASAFIAADNDPVDGLISFKEWAAQALLLGIEPTDAQNVFKQIQWNPRLTPAEDHITAAHYVTLNDVVNITQDAVLMNSLWNTPEQMFLNADQDGNEAISREEFEGQATGMIELTKRNAQDIWLSVATRDQAELHEAHYLILFGRVDIATFRTLIQFRFEYVVDTWNASNPNGDNIVTRAEFSEFILADYGFDHLIADILWDIIDNDKKGYVLFVRYVALGLGRVQQVSLVGLRSFLQSIYPTREEVKDAFDINSNTQVTVEELLTFNERLGLTEENANQIIVDLCPEPMESEGMLLARQIDALSYDIGLSALRTLVRSEHKNEGTLEPLIDTNKDGSISSDEWLSFLAPYSVSQSNAMLLFALMDPSQRGSVATSQLRIFRGRVALCDYRELVEAEYGTLFDALTIADLDMDGKVMPDEFIGQARSFCLSDSESLELHAELDVQEEGFIDLTSLGAERMPFMLHRNGSLVGYRTCLQSYFKRDSALISQDIETANDGFPATFFGFLDQGARIAWEVPFAMGEVLKNVDVFNTGEVSKTRYSQLFAGEATLAGLRIMLFEVAPNGDAELFSRVDRDDNGEISLPEFVHMMRLLDYSVSNAELLYVTLNFAGMAALSQHQLGSITLGTVTFSDLRLLSHGEFPPPDGVAAAAVAADKDRSNTVDFWEFVEFSGSYLAVLNVTNLREIFTLLEIVGDGHLRAEQFEFLSTHDFDLASMRHLIVLMISIGHPVFDAVDTYGDGTIDMEEFRHWANRTLMVNNESSMRVFSDLDMCGRGYLQPLHAEMLKRNPDIVLLRAMLLSRYGRDWKAFSAADSNDDNELVLSEFEQFCARLMVAPHDGAVFFHRLDFGKHGFLTASELRIVSGTNLRLFDFRRLSLLAFPNSSIAFQLADIDGDQLITFEELVTFACDHLALRASDSLAAIYRLSDTFGIGAIPESQFKVFAGDVDVDGYRKLVQSMWITYSDSFFEFDLDFDRHLNVTELILQAAPMVISRENAEELFKVMASRDPDVIHLDIYIVVIEGISGLRTLIREKYDDSYALLLEIDVREPWNKITLDEFQDFVSLNWQLPRVIVNAIFMRLDIRQENFLTRSVLDTLLAADVNHILLQQLVESALGDLSTAFDKADSDDDEHVTLEELELVSKTLGLPSENSAILFKELDVEDAGFLTRSQFTVMSRANQVFRLSNLQSEENRFHIYELKLYSDEDCSPGSRIECELPVSSGHYVDLRNLDASTDAAALAVKHAVSASFDGNPQSRWIAQCKPCEAQDAHVGCKFSSGLQVRCVEIFQTSSSEDVDGNTNTSSSQTNTTNPPSGRRLDILAKVAAGFKMQTWSGIKWETLVDVPKPPLWEIDNIGAPLTFITTIPEIIIPGPEKFVHVDEQASQKFEEEYGMRLELLISLAVVLTIAGLIVFCVIFPMLVSPRCLSMLRRNAPERMDARRGRQLELQFESALEIEALEEALKEKATNTDEWGIMRHVPLSTNRLLTQKLEKEKRRQAKLEAKATENRKKREEQAILKEQRRQAHLERLRRMREAYKAKTIAIDGLALRAPPAVLQELGFDPDMIEAFGLPGFEDLSAAEDEEARIAEEERILDEEEAKRRKELEGDEDKEDGNEEEEELPDEVDDPLQVPPKLEEIMGKVVKEGAKHRHRRMAMPGSAEGEPMSRESVTAAARIASSLHIADLEEEDEVDRWLQAAADLIARDGKESSDLIYFESQEVNEEQVAGEFARLIEKFDSRRNAALLQGEEIELVAKREEEHEEDIDADYKAFAELFNGDIPSTIDVFGDERPSFDGAAAGAAGGQQMGVTGSAVKHALALAEEEEVDKGPLPYGGKVYPGMPVRPRGLGTPRGDRLNGEVYRSAQTGAETPYGEGRQWGRYLTQKTHFVERKKFIKADDEEDEPT
jgi:CUB/sushi domain-containing protein